MDPDSLTEPDTAEITLPYGEGGAAVPEQKYRDVLKYPEGKERIDMCVALEEMRTESRLEGKIEGAVKYCTLATV